MRILCLLAVAAASVSALDWHDAGREPIFVAGGATVLNNEGRKASGDEPIVAHGNGHVQMARQAQHHCAARLRTAGFKKCDVAR